MSKDCKYLDLGRTQIPLNKKQKETLDTSRKPEESYKQAIIRITHQYLDGELVEISSLPSEIKEEGKSEFDYEEWEQRRNEACPNCESKPYLKDAYLCVFCPLPNWTGKGKSKGEKGEIRIESCLRTQNYYLKRKEKEKKEIDLMTDKISQLNAQIERLEKERTEEYKESADKLHSLFKGESIYCHLKKRIIPLWQCFEDQTEHAKTPKHFIPHTSEYCPCQKFNALEVKEMAKYQNIETMPLMNPEIQS